MKTSELTDIALDWAVWTAAGGATAYPKTASGSAFLKLWNGNSAKYVHPSTDWSQGGPIIEREMLTVGPAKHQGFMAWAWPKQEGFWGDTPLIAAMRCFVASKLGTEVEIPEELTR